MRSPRCCGLAGCGWKARRRSWARTHRANPSRRREAERDPSLHPLDPVAQLCRLLELLVVDCPPQPLAQLAEDRRALQGFVLRGAVRMPDMAGVAVHAPKEFADAVLELRVASRASPPPGRAKVGHGRTTKVALRAIRWRRDELLLHLVQK